MSNNNGPEVTVELNGTVAQFAMIKLVAGLGVVTSGVASEDNALFAIAQEAGVAGDKIRARVINASAISDILVSGAISKGARVFTGASGKGTATATSLTSPGIALEASTADGDVIRVAHTVGSNDDIT